MSETYDTGLGFFLKQTDSKGRIVNFLTLSRVDFSKLTSDDVARLTMSNTIFSFNDEQSQVTGMVYVGDFKHLTLKWSAVLPLTFLKSYAAFVHKGVPLRIKEVHIFNIPPITIPLLNTVLSLFSEKIRKRVHFYKSLEDMKPFFDTALLPKEYGGTIPMDEMIAAHKENLRRFRPELLENLKMFKDVRTSLVECDNEFDGAVGSFRKLEVD